MLAQPLLIVGTDGANLNDAAVACQVGREVAAWIAIPFARGGNNRVVFRSVASMMAETVHDSCQHCFSPCSCSPSSGENFWGRLVAAAPACYLLITIVMFG